MLAVREALGYIGKRGSARSHEIESAFGLEADEADELLRESVAAGALVTCRIQRPGMPDALEYRLAASLPRKRPSHELKKPPTPIQPTSAAAAVHAHPGEPMSAIDKICIAFAKHGPMTTRQLGAHVKLANLSSRVWQFAARGILGRLGGGKGTTIYGLPDQAAPEAAGEAPDAKLSRAVRTHKMKAGKTRGKYRVKRTEKTPAQSTESASTAPRGFRCALYNDGSLRIEHEGEEINLLLPETRALMAYLEKVFGAAAA